MKENECEEAISGMALGVDTVFALAVLELKKFDECIKEISKKAINKEDVKECVENAIVMPCCLDINQDIARFYNVSEGEAFDFSREDILYNKWKENAVKGNKYKHNVLYDAKVIREVYQIINEVEFKYKSNFKRRKHGIRYVFN